MVVATGAYEQPLVFDHNDLPGVMLGSAAQRLARLHGVAPGRRVLMATANDDGWQVAADMLAAGVAVAAIVDERAREDCASPYRDRLAGEAPVFWKHTISAALGAGRVTGARIKHVETGAAQALECDTILMSVAWAPAAELAYQAGAKLEFDEARGELRPASLPPSVFLAGRAAGAHRLDNELLDGRLAGMSAAAFVGKAAAPEPQALASLAAQKAAEPVRTSQRVSVPGHQKRIVCFCEDVTEKDIAGSVA